MKLDNWKIYDMVKRGILTYSIGDEVVVFRRNKDGHPKSLDDNKIYTIHNINIDGHLILRYKIGKGWSKTIKVHRKYMINKSKFRDLKIEMILN
jgi:hypothetical protein